MALKEAAQDLLVSATQRVGASLLQQHTLFNIVSVAPRERQRQPQQWRVHQKVSHKLQRPLPSPPHPTTHCGQAGVANDVLAV